MPDFWTHGSFLERWLLQAAPAEEGTTGEEASSIGGAVGPS